MPKTVTCWCVFFAQFFASLVPEEKKGRGRGWKIRAISSLPPYREGDVREDGEGGVGRERHCYKFEQEKQAV